MSNTPISSEVSPNKLSYTLEGTVTLTHFNFHSKQDPTWYLVGTHKMLIE